MRAAVLIAVSAAAALLAGSAGARVSPTGDWPVQGVDYEIIVTDNPAAQRFDLKQVVKTNRFICLEEESWPDRGQIWGGGDYGYVEAGGQRYPIHGDFEEYCPRGCAPFRATPHRPLAGLVPYEAVSADALKQPHHMVFKAHAFSCYSGQEVRTSP
jgi:hypothetical protein